jgi:hypothetical protein
MKDRVPIVGNYYSRNKEKCRAASRKWYAENKDKILEKHKARSRKWYAENKDKAQETHKKYQKAHQDHLKVKTKEYREKNQDKIRERRKDWRRRGNGFSKDMFVSLLERQGGRCAICKELFIPGQTQRQVCADHDHVTSRPRGLLCQKCNLLIGLARDDATVLKGAMDYLKSWIRIADYA